MPTSATKFAVSPPKLGFLFRLWFFALILPAFFARALLIQLSHESYAAARIETKQILAEDLRRFKLDCSIKQFIKNNLGQIEKTAGLPDLHGNLRFSEENFQLSAENTDEKLRQAFRQILGIRPLLLMCAGSGSTEVKIITDENAYPWFPRPGRKAALEIMSHMMHQQAQTHKSSPVPENASRLLNNFAVSISGSYFSILNQQEEVAEGFLDKGSGDKVFSVRRSLLDLNGRCVFTYLALFPEAEFNRARLIKSALSPATPTKTTRNFKLLPANAYPFISSKGNRLQMISPAPFALLRLGSHQNHDLLSHLFNQGLMEKKPARVPFLSVSTRIDTDRQDFFNRIFSIAAIYAAFFSLIIFQATWRQEPLQCSIRGKLFLAILSSAILPCAAFFYSAGAYYEQMARMHEMEQTRHMLQRLKSIELRFRSEDEALNEEMKKGIVKLSQPDNQSEEKLKSLLKDLRTRRIAGLALVRSDGLLIEDIDLKRINRARAQEKFNLSRNILYASVLKFQQMADTQNTALMQRFHKVNGGRQIISIADFLWPMDVDNFCSNEGRPFSVNQSDGSFRFRVFRFQVITDDKTLTSHLLLAEDLDMTTAHIIDRIAAGLNLYRDQSRFGLQEIAFVGTFDLDSTRINPERSWPPSFRPDPQTSQAIQAISGGKSEFIIKDRKFTTARKIAGFPLIAVSASELATGNFLHHQIGPAMFAALAMLLLAMILAAGLISRLFIAPIDALIEATENLQKGIYCRINNHFNNELATITGEFNNMTAGLQQRERLQRFVSADALQTISNETRTQQLSQGKKVKRSVLFCHIKNFSAPEENIDPHEFFKLLNRYFSAMEACITENHGQIDKYIGEAIMAVFADDDGKKSSIKALSAAEAMQCEAAELGLEIGIGISTGEVISGKIGSRDGRQDFTVIGDRVNFSARLEALTHRSGAAKIFVDADTAAECHDYFSLSCAGEIQVKGKTFAEKIFKLNNND